MIHNLKVFGLALAAMFVLSAIAVSAASAQTGMITSDGPVTLLGTELGTEENRLESFGGFVECPGSVYTAHKYNVTPHEKIPSGATTATLTPHYKQTTATGAPNCKGPFGISATVDMNGCDYVIHAGVTTGGLAGTYGVTFDVVCPLGKEITVTLWESETEHTNKPTSPYCDLHVKAQTGLAGAHLTDEGNGHLRLQGTVENIHVTRTATRPSLTCLENGTTNTGKFKLNVTVEDSSGTSLSLSHL